MNEYVLLGDTVPVMCSRCGARVGSTTVHDQWHSDLEGDIASAALDAAAEAVYYHNGQGHRP